MDWSLSTILRFVIVVLVVLIVYMLASNLIGGAEESYRGAAADISPKCGGWQALHLCQKACDVDNACDTTYCDPDSPKQKAEGVDTCEKFLEKMKSRIVVDVSPKEVELSKGDAVIHVRVKDQNGMPLSADLSASGAGEGTGSTDNGGVGELSIKLKKIGIIKIIATPKDTASKLSSAQAVVSVVERK